MSLKLLELFSGYGSQALALKNLGIEFTSEISEIDKYAIQAYMQLHGETKNYGDITQIERLNYADLWTYSSPCQDFSTAGKQKGIYNADGSLTRSGLLKHVERLLTESVLFGTQPKYLLMENVKGLVSKKFKPDFDRWLAKLETLGYNNYWQVLNAKDYGVPQNRERVFVVSIRKDINQGYTFPEPIKLEKRLKDVLEENVDEKYYLSDKLVQGFLAKIERGKEHPTGFNRQINICDQEGVSTTLTSRYHKCGITDPYIEDTSKTIRTSGFSSLDKHSWDVIKEPIPAASRGRNPDNPSDRTADTHTEQRLELNEDGITNTLTTVQKDNYVVEPQVKQLGVLKESTRTNGRTQDRVYSANGLSPTLNTCQGGNLEPKIVEPLALDEQNEYIRKDGTVGTLTTDGSSPKHNNRIVELQIVQNPHGFNKDGIFENAPTITSNGKYQNNNFLISSYRIRKLTPRECFRLMGVADEDFNKLHDISKTQLYKLAGNSIVVDVLMAIFRNLFISDKETKGQLTLF